MKKLSKFAAVVAAMALLMAMSTSAFAAVNGSPEAEKVSVGTVTINGTNDADCEIVGTAIPKNEQIKPDAAKDIVEKKLGVTVKDNEGIVILDAMDLKYKANAGAEAIDLEKGIPVKFTLDVSKALGTKYANAKYIYVLHEKAPGEWEVQKCEVKGGYITVELDGLSPVYLAVIEQKANADNNVANKDGKSPKTGF